MRYLRYLILLAVVALPAAYSQAQVSIRVHIGQDYGLYNAPPVCPYGFYPDYPFGCAPYGYWGPEWFANGVFIGAGPWHRFYYTHPQFYRRYYYVRPNFHDDYRVRYDRFHNGDHGRDWEHDRGRHRGDDHFRSEREFHDHGKHRGWDKDRGRGHDRD